MTHLLRTKRCTPWSLTASPLKKMLVGRQSFPFGFRSLFRGKLAVKLWAGIRWIRKVPLRNSFSPQREVRSTEWHGCQKAQFWRLPKGKLSHPRRGKRFPMFVIQFHHLQNVMNMGFHKKNTYWKLLVFCSEECFSWCFMLSQHWIAFWLIVLVILSDLGWYQGHSVPVILSCLLLIHVSDSSLFWSKCPAGWFGSFSQLITGNWSLKNVYHKNLKGNQNQ